jgi:hypothetical protein
VMMIGNGGWSYTLNRNPAVANSSLPTASPAAADSPKTAQVIFDGRTPCREIADIAGLSMGADCFKIKWRITLNRDPATFQPTTFTIDSTFARDKPIQGKWTETKTGDAVIYRLAPDARAKPVSLVLADDDLLLFLDRNDRPLTGNEDFSFTIERRPPTGSVP